MIHPPRLRPGDAITVVAPAGPVPEEAFAAGARILEARYRLVHDAQRLFTRTGYLAGSDEERAAELSAALADPSTGAVFCARGGYGAMRVIERGLDPRAFAAAPKALVGFSDVTALHAWAQRAGVASVHGPTVTQLGTLPREDLDALFALLESPDPAPPLDGLRSLCPGTAEGILRGGNLELIASLVGTPCALPLRDAVLLLEEVGERPYRIDRALTQLRLSGALSTVRAVVLGELTRCEEPDGSGPSAEEVVRERLGDLGVPVLAGAPVGHGARNRALVLGGRVRVDADQGRLEPLEPAVR